MDKNGKYITTDIAIEESKFYLQMLDLFDGKFSNTELDNMDIPQINSLIEAKTQLINEREEQMRKAQSNH